MYRSGLVWSRMKSNLKSTVGRALYSDERHPDEDARGRLREIFLEVVSHQRAATVTRLDVLLDRLPELCEIWDWDFEWESGVMVEQAVRVEELRAVSEIWADYGAFRQQMHEICDGVKLQEERLIRVRNAAQHGGPILDESVRSVGDFADHHRQQIIANMVHGVVNGRDCSSTLAAVTDLKNLRLDVLNSKKSPLQALAATVDFP